ncbi:MAG: response regulator [Ignavibacteriales bacterium]|nr:response regulator [Ignavibacteriales bacterium]
MVSFLIIDDDESIRTLFRTILKKKFVCEVFEADNGVNGLSALQKNLPDIILLDLMMPVMDGIETLDSIRANPAFKTIPVFVITAVGDREVIRNLCEKNITDYLLKPIDVNETVERIQRMINRLGESKKIEPVGKTGRVNSKEKANQILIVDNDAEFKNFFNDLLNERFIIHQASNVNEGFTVFSDHQPKFIFMSNNLSLLDKIILSQKIREISSDKEVEIYLLIDNMKLLPSKIHSYNGVIRKTTDKELFLKDIYFLNEEIFETKRTRI